MPNSLELYWLSFVDSTDGHFLGGCLVEAFIASNAIQQAYLHNCNPGGEVLILNIGVDVPEGSPPIPINTLLQQDEIPDAVKITNKE